MTESSHSRSGNRGNVKSEYVIPVPFENVKRWGHQLVRKNIPACNVTITLSQAEKENLDQMAKLLNCSRSWIIRFLVMAMSRKVLDDAGIRYHEFDDFRDNDARSGTEGRD